MKTELAIMTDNMAKKSLDSDEAEDFFHSAILAKHGISYDASPKGEGDSDRNNLASKDAADRLLDAMDKQLGNVLLTKIDTGDVNDDPGTDPDSVRSLRDRVMSDLATSSHQPSRQGREDFTSATRNGDAVATGPRHMKRISPSYRSASASRYDHRDRTTNDSLPSATQKALGSSLDRLGLHHQPGALSARNTSRKGRDLERSRDRLRLNGNRSNMPRSSSISSLSTLHTEDYEDRYKRMMVRHVAGVPVTSFDGVTIASDLDSVYTEAVREHFIDSLRKSKDHESTTSADSAKPTSHESRSLRDRYNRLKHQEKMQGDDTREDTMDASTFSRSSRTPLKVSHQTEPRYTDRKSDSGLQDLSKGSKSNDSLHTNDSVLSQNGVLPNRCRTTSRHPSEQIHMSTDADTMHRGLSKPSSSHSSRHNRAHSVGPTSRRERPTARRYSNDLSPPMDFSNSRSQRSDNGLESGRDRRRVTSNALNKLQELDSQIEEIEKKKRSGEQDLKLMEKTMEGHRISLLKLEEKLRESQAKADDARTELMVLEFKKDQCEKELQSATKECERAQEGAKETEYVGMTYDEIVALMQERDELRARFRRGEASRTTIAERQELERALHAAKDDLFRERKMTRERVEELEEKLEETEHNFETMELEKNAEIKRLGAIMHETHERKYHGGASEADAMERVNTFEAEKENLCEKLEVATKQLQQKDGEIVSLATESNRSREENRHLREKVAELESKVAEQIELRERLISEAERNANASKKDKEQAIASEKRENEGEIERILQDIEKEKARALAEYKSERQEEICKLQTVIENKEKEIDRLGERLHREEDAKRALGEKLRMDAKEQVRSAIAKERFAWEREREMADKQEDDVRKANSEKEKFQLTSEVDEARNKCKIATEQISRLRAEIEELRLANRKLLQEKLDAVSDAREQERKEQTKKLDQLRAELEELNQAEIVKHRSKCAKLEEELRRAKGEKNEAMTKCKDAISNCERSERCFVAEVHDECQKMADLMRGIRTPSQSRNRASSAAVASRSGSHISRSNRPTNAEGAVSQLRAVSDDVRATLRDLTTEVETHRRSAQIAQRERDRAMSNGSGSTPSGSSKHLSQQIAELNGHNSADIKALSKQLSEKDGELRDIQRNMSLWKDTTAQKLAQKFEEELAVQLERKLSRHRMEHKRRFERMEGEIAHLATSHAHSSMHYEYDASSSLVPPVSSTPVKGAPPHGGAAGDKGTVKLLRHLQGRVKQLRTENDLLRSNSQIMDYEGFRKSR